MIKANPYTAMPHREFGSRPPPLCNTTVIQIMEKRLANDGIKVYTGKNFERRAENETDQKCNDHQLGG
jgi:hypothetical protein